MWEHAKADSAEGLSDEDVLIEVATTIALPVDVVWSYLIDGEYRQILNGADRMELSDVRNGRAGEGSVSRCWHGARETTQLIVDWRSLQSFVTRDTTKMGGATFTFPVEYLLEELPQGTRLVQRSGISDGPFMARAIMKRLLPLRMKDQFQEHLDAFGEASERAYERRMETVDAGS